MPFPTDQNLQALALPSDLVARYDVRRVAELITDSGVRPDTSQIIVEGTTPYNAVKVFLIDATQMILSASRVAARYTLTQLYGDPTVSPAIPGSTLAKRLCCDLAFALMTGRRGYASKDSGALTPRAEEAERMLEALRRGERIFDIYEIVNGKVVMVDDHAQAGLPQAFRLTPDDDASLLTSNTRFFGVRVPRPYSSSFGW